MNQVLKFRIEPSHKAQLVSLPENAHITTAIAQGYDIVMYAVCPYSSRKEVRKVCLVGTGWDMPKGNWSFVATVHIERLGEVYHLFQAHRGESL